MTLMISLLVISAALEILLYFGAWRARTLLCLLLGCLSVFSSVGLFYIEPNGLSACLLALGLYRLFNYARILVEHVHAKQLMSSSRKAGLWLIIMQLTLLWFIVFFQKSNLNSDTQWIAAAALMCTAAVISLASVLKSLKKTQLNLLDKTYTNSELPSITVAIPARNETSQLEETLQAIIASDYPKLEIMVLDDCSQNKRTPEIIRGFAQDGVRFLAGETPKDGWLAKNQAYQQLYEASSGEYLVFMGVDVQLSPKSLRLLVSSVLAKEKTMMSILPLRSLQSTGHYSLSQPIRYLWEFLPLRRIFNRPPVLSSCWIIKRSKLKQYGTFAAASNTITPEAYFARKAIADNDSYSFTRSNRDFGVYSTKNSEAQRMTAVRSRYPQLHRRLELVTLASIAQIFLLLGPYAIGIVGFFVAIPDLAHYGALAAVLLLTVQYMAIVFTTKINPMAFGFIAFPFAVMNDIWLLHYSLYKYEFSTIEWKGRNVCIPVMQVIPHLPRLEK